MKEQHEKIETSEEQSQVIIHKGRCDNANKENEGKKLKFTNTANTQNKTSLRKKWQIEHTKKNLKEEKQKKPERRKQNTMKINIQG